MIVREFLDRPEIIDKFDFANDAKDTIAWLKQLGTHVALLRAKTLETAYDLFLKN